MPRRRKSLEEALEAERIALERQKQLEEEKQRNLERIYRENLENSLREKVLKESIEKFEDLRQKILQIKNETKTQSEWEKHTKCEWPDTKVPASLRDFLTKLKIYLNGHWQWQINLWLKCDERSILTQDIRVPDTTKETMMKQRGPIGNFYDEKLQIMLKVYGRLSETIRRNKLSLKCFEDLLKIRDEIRATSFNLLDVLTFEVVKHIDREMLSISPQMANYFHKSSDFTCFVWTFKDVPLPETYNYWKTIKMDPLNITVKVSNLIDLDGTVVRGLWFKHDFFTDLCPSFNALREMEFVDLKTSLMFEFQTRQSIINVHLNEMREVRETYEMKMEEIRKEEESQKKSKKVQENVKVGKAKKIEVEPPIVDESTYVDVEAEYVNYEDQQMEKQMNCMSPRNFNLKEHEMNMREYQIVKGVFKIECFDRPCQWTDVNQQMFTRLNDDYNLLQYQTFEHEYSEPEIKPQRKSIIDKNPVDPRAVALADLIRVEIKLDENIFWPEVPVVCRWELWEESEEFEALDTETKDFNLNYDKIMMEESEKLFSASEQKHCLRMKLSDFDLKTAPENIKLSNLIKHYIVPMMPYEFHYFNEQLEIFEKKQREWKQILQAKKKISENDVENLNLKEIFTENLSKIDIRNITVDEFNKLFDAKNYQPRELFPINYPELIEIIPNSELENLSEVKEKESLEELIRKQKERDDDDVDIGLQRPLKDEPLLVTELHEQVNKLKESLRPIFREIKREEDSVSFRVSDKSKRPRYRSNRASMLRRSIARDSKRQQSESPKRRSQRRSSRQRQSSKVRTRTSKRDEVELPEDKPERSSSSKNQQESSKKVLVPHNVGKWSTKYIYESSFDHELKSVAFYSGRLGNFGLATRKYCHFPLKNWELYPEDDHIVMKVESRHASIEFKITSDGYTFDVIHPRKPPFKGIKTPIKVFELKKLLKSLNLNFFPEIDASFYIENICEKHQAMEIHTYKSMAVCCFSYHFKSNVWNRWAHRRVAIFEARMKDEDSFKVLMATPLRVASVNVHEKCTELDVVELEYEMDPIEQEFHPDLLDFLKDEGNETINSEDNFEKSKTIWFIQALLMNICPLSFSN